MLVDGEGDLEGPAGIQGVAQRSLLSAHRRDRVRLLRIREDDAVGLDAEVDVGELQERALELRVREEASDRVGVGREDDEAPVERRIADGNGLIGDLRATDVELEAYAGELARSGVVASATASSRSSR